MSTTKRDYPRFIQNSADGNDKFPEQSQEKLSSAISKLILEKEQKSKIIGLEGDWGSGKSNVVRMIKRKLDKTHHFYIHDVWSYQEDLQRRSFLESLTADLCRGSDTQEPFITNTTKWNKELKHLLAKRKETSTDVIPVFSPGFLFVISLVFFWTILKDFAGPITFVWGGEIHPNFWVVVLAIAGYFAFSIKSRRLLRLKDVFYLYNEKDTKKVTNETVFEDEPSVERFHKWITDLQKDFPNNKELVVVFDNMDRLPKEKVKQIWSLIHTFFSELCFDKIWVIVPYSREQLTRAFNDKPEETDHFIDKTFTIQYHVPPPILSDWKTFFGKLYTEAFGETEVYEFPIVQSIFDRLNDKITPRKIIIFFNEIVALKKVWADEIKLRYIALYALSKREILKNPSEEILSRRFLGGTEPMFANDESLVDNISALIYNIPIKSAGQVALGQELRTILRSGGSDKIGEFAQLPFFVELLENTIRGESSETYGFESVLDSIPEELYDKLDSRKMQNVWNILGNNYWTRREVDQKFTESDKIMLKRIENHSRQGFINKLSQNIRSIREDMFSGGNYYNGLKEIESFISTPEFSSLNFDNILKELKVKPEAFVDFLKSSSADGQAYRRYKITTDSIELNNSLNQKSLDDLRDLVCLTQLKGDVSYNLTEFRKSLKQKIDSEQLTAINVGEVVLIYKSLVSQNPIPPFLGAVKIDEFLPQIDAGNVGYIDLIAMRVKLALSSTEPDYFNSMQTDDNVKKIANRISDYITVNDVFSAVLNNQSPFLSKVVHYWVSNSEENEKPSLTASKMLPNLMSLSSILVLEPRDMLNFISMRNIENIESLSSSQLLEIINNDIAFKHIVETENSLCDKIISESRKFLSELSESEWLAKIKEPNSLEVDMLCIILKKEFPLPEAALRAYRQGLIDYSTGSFVLEQNMRIKWQTLHDAVEKSHLNAALKEIRDYYIYPSNPTITIEQFKFFANMFVQQDIISDYPADVCRRILKPVISDLDILNDHILKNQQYYASIITKAKEDAEMLVDDLRVQGTNNPDNHELSAFLSLIIPPDTSTNGG